MATCAAIVETEVPDDAGQDSCNILPALLGEEAEQPLREAIVHHSSTGVFSIRHGDWKLILGTQGSGGWPPPRDGGPDSDIPGQLYHIYDDPGETNNVWEAYPEIVERLTVLLDKFKQDGHSQISRHPNLKDCACAS